MTTISFNADYAHILTKQGFVSTEQARYYLTGVYVHPCVNQPGAFLVATDGHKLGCFYDAEAVAPMAAIVRLSADGVRVTKPHKIERRRLVVDITASDGEGTDARASAGTAKVVNEAGDVVCGIAGEIVDGTFPDWQRVVPSFPLPKGEHPAETVAYNVAYLGAFGFRDPTSRASSGPVITFDQTDARGPARVLNAHYPNFLGVIMPCHPGKKTRVEMLPEWYADRPATADTETAA